MTDTLSRTAGASGALVAGTESWETAQQQCVPLDKWLEEWAGAEFSELVA